MTSNCSRTAFRRLGSALLACGILACVTAGTAAGQTQLKMGYGPSFESQIGAGGNAFVQEVAKLTAGRIKIEQYPNSVLGGEVETLKAVQLGAIDIAFITGAPLPNFVPEVGVFNIPFLFRDARHAHAVMDSAIGQGYLKKFRDKNLVALAWGENGMRQLTNSKREITSPEDLKGLKLRVPQSDVMVAAFRALGADVSSLALPQLYGALQSGQFDGQENPIATIQASKFDQVQKFLTVSSHVYDPAVIVMSAEAYDELSEADRLILVRAAKVGAEMSRKVAGEAQLKGIAELERAGMTVTPKVDADRFAAAMSSAMPALEKRFGADVIAAVRAAK